MIQVKWDLTYISNFSNSTASLVGFKSLEDTETFTRSFKIVLIDIVETLENSGCGLNEIKEKCAIEKWVSFVT